MIFFFLILKASILKKKKKKKKQDFINILNLEWNKYTHTKNYETKLKRKKL